MRSTILILSMSVAVTGALAFVPAPPAPAAPAAPAPSAQATFDRIKGLAGTWDADLGSDGTNMTVVTYRVISNGTAVVETLFAGGPEEMETIFTRDGDRVICTHYCAAGNQPRMQAKTITPDSITFEMVDATNLPDQSVRHMGGLKMEFLGKDHYKTVWTSLEKSTAVESVTFDMKRRAAGVQPPVTAKPATK